MHKIVRKSEAIVRQIASNKTVSNLITKEISPAASFAVTNASEYHEKEITPYDRIYFVLDGELKLTFDSQTYTLYKGDSCFIGKGTQYEMRGTFEVAVVNQPAFGAY
ncbi:MAG TPA: cupin domain-containing protein [Candidatus Saccharimonadales bacterium]|nr:cupin domain-containing protein [Candidatus Saccharimonadales bacterium]